MGWACGRYWKINKYKVLIANPDHFEKERLRGILLKWISINEAQVKSNWPAVLNTRMNFRVA